MKWKNLGYSECTWEDASFVATHAQDQIDALLDRNNSSRIPAKSAPVVKKRPEFKKFTTQPSWIRGGELRDYQLLGVNWMAYLWHKNDNGILADEMFFCSNPGDLARRCRRFRSYSIFITPSSYTVHSLLSYRCLRFHPGTRNFGNGRQSSTL